MGDKSEITNNTVQINNEDHSSHFFSIYRKYISPTDGARCPMYPSCSIYSKLVIEKYGFVKGFIMTVDRIARCGNDLYLYDSIIIDRKNLYEDYPSSAHKAEYE